MRGLLASDSVRILAVLAAFLVSSEVSAQNALDREARADYLKFEKLLTEMPENLDDKGRRERMGAFQESAREFIGKYAAQASKLTTGLFDLARAYLHVLEPAKATPHLEAFLRMQPKHSDAVEAKLMLGDMYRATGRLDEATALYLQFIGDHAASDKVADARLGLATSYYFNLKLDESIKVYEDILKLHADHRVAPDAAVQLIDALLDADRLADARGRLAKLLKAEPDAPHLKDLDRIASRVGEQAADVMDIATWVGPKGAKIGQLRGKVVVLCFFANWSARCAWELQALSKMQASYGDQGLVVYGVTKTYKAGKKDWTLEKEAAWLNRYRQNPRFVLERELRTRVPTEASAKRDWDRLANPITIPFVVTNSAKTLRDYKVRGVPCIVIVDKTGRIRLMKEGGGPGDGFQRRLVSKRAQELLLE